MKFEQLKEIFADVRGTAFVGIDTLSEVKLKGGKKNPFQGRVTKRTAGSNVTVAFGDDSAYANAVKKRMVAEGKDPATFELKPRTWGTRISGTPFIEHGEKHYLECIFNHAGETTYFVDGVETDPATIEGLELSVPKPSETAQGGIENQVIIRTYDVNSIETVRFKGEHSA